MAVEDKILRDCWKLLEKASQTILESAELLARRKTILEIGGDFAPELTIIEPTISQRSLNEVKNLQEYISSQSAYHQQKVSLKLI